jgi:hypothetical protein
MKKIWLIATLLISSWASAQELNAVVTVNTQQVNLSNRSVFKTLEKSLQEFINQTRWTDLKVRENERIRCNFTLVINKYENTNYEATLLVQSSRPVYNTSYQSPVFNLQDKEVTFSYQEFEPLTFNENAFESNLTSVVAYYAYLLLGFDADTFAEAGGTPYFAKAKQIASIAQTSSYSGWSDTGKNNRFLLINELISENYEYYHKSLYQYHRLGLDKMSNNEKEAKETLQKSIISLGSLPNLRLNSYAMTLFFNAKTEEIAAIFSAGTLLDTKVLKETLLSLAPTQATKWNAIK